MKFDKKLEGNDLTITIEGRLDTNTAPELEKELADLSGIQNLILDLEKLEYISSAGLRIVLMLHKTMSEKGKFIIKNVSEDVREVLKITGFLEILTIE